MEENWKTIKVRRPKAIQTLVKGKKYCGCLLGCLLLYFLDVQVLI